MCLNNETNGKLTILGVPILKHFRVVSGSLGLLANGTETTLFLTNKKDLVPPACEVQTILNTADLCYLKHKYLKVPSYIKEYSLVYMSTPLTSNHWYLMENFLVTRI